MLASACHIAELQILALNNIFLALACQRQPAAAFSLRRKALFRNMQSMTAVPTRDLAIMHCGLEACDSMADEISAHDAAVNPIDKVLSTAFNLESI